MKKLLLLSTVACMLAVTVNAQVIEANLKKEIKSEKKEMKVYKEEKRTTRKALRKLEGTEVSKAAKQQFKEDFKNASNVQWVRTTNFDKATFTKDGQSMSAFYDAESKLVGTTVNKSFSDLPARGQNVINSKYKDYIKGKVIFFDDNELNDTDMSLYGNQFDDIDSYFIELSKGNNKIVLQVGMEGNVTYFTHIR